MAIHASCRRSVVNPGTKLWRPPDEATQFWRRGAVLANIFNVVKPNKNEFISMKPNSNLHRFQQLLFHTIPQNI